MKMHLAIATCLGFAVTFPILASAHEHAVMQGTDLKWKAGPPALPPGAQAAVLVGDPAKEGAYVIRLKLPSGYKIPPHTHPQDENVTVISGTFHFAMGAAFDDTKGMALKPGGYANAAKGMQHYAWASEETIIQLHGIGPQGVTYVNPADDPRKK